jgi:hypothetical protein
MDGCISVWSAGYPRFPIVQWIDTTEQVVESHKESSWLSQENRLHFPVVAKYDTVPQEIERKREL